MADKYLNENCKFRCNCAAGANVYTAAAGKQTGVKLHGRLVLTASTVLLPVAGIFCTRQPNPEGTPPYLPCALCAAGVTWTRCSKNICMGEPMLTERSKALCNGFGGRLMVVIPSGNITCRQNLGCDAIGF